MALRTRLFQSSAHPQQAVYRAHLTLALLSTATHTALLFFELTHVPEHILVLSIALGISVLISALLLTRRVPLGVLTAATSYGMPLWLVAEIGRNAVTGHEIPMQYYLSMGIVAVINFSSLRPRRAVLVSGLMILGVSAVVLLHAPLEIPLLLYTLFLISLIAFLAVYGQSVQAERLRSELLHSQAHTDALTGALNRRGGGQHLDTVLEVDTVLEGKQLPPAAVLLLDIDRFKDINDRYGHALGDRVLVAVARVAQAAAGPEATVTRWGGEEFLVVWPDTTPEQAHRASAQMLEAIRTLQVGELPRLTVSGGLAFAHEAGGRDEWVNLADRRMYAAKQAGGDRWL